MKISILAGLAILPGVVLAAEPARLPGSGHWEGNIQIQKKAVKITVDLAQDQTGKWAGSVEFPGLNLTNTPFSAITINDASVYLESRESLLAIDAKLSSDGKSIEGGFQSGFLMAIPVPVRLQRVSEPKVTEACESASLSKDLEGTWEGELTLESSWENGDQRAGSRSTVRVTLANGPDGIGRGTLKKPGSSDAQLPLSAIQQSPGRLRFEVKGAGVAFTAELKDHQLVGEWNQFDLDPVLLKLGRVDPK